MVKPGTLIKIVKAMPGISEDAKQYANGDIFEVGFEWQCGGGVTTTQNLELFNWEFVVFAEEVVEFGEKPPMELMWGDVEPINSPGESTWAIVEEKVDHPSHYNTSKFETIEVIEELTQGYKDSYVGFCVGNTIKYLARAPYKHDTPVEDLRKAERYIQFALARLTKSE